MYIEKLKVKDLDDNKDGFVTVLLSEEEIATLDNLMYKLSKGKVLTGTEYNLRKDFKVLHSLVVFGMLPDSEIIELYKSGDYKDDDVDSTEPNVQ